MKSDHPGQIFLAEEKEFGGIGDVSVWASLDEDVDDIFYVKHHSVVVLIHKSSPNKTHTPECFVLTSGGLGWIRSNDLVPVCTSVS